MPSLTFYPLGCADTTLVELADGRRMLVDYADTRGPGAPDKRCDLPTLLKDDLRDAGRHRYAVVAFSHLDDDHCRGSSDFFHLEHAARYQGAGRHEIDELWVPAAAITEEGLADCARAIRQEARHRLRNGRGIKVFSRPERLQAWLAGEGIRMQDRLDCLVDAGRLVPGYDLPRDGVEFFVHSPHARRTDDRGVEDRNGDSLVFQARFRVEGYDTDILFMGDVDHEVISEIVDITRRRGRGARLHWNLYHLPHHCSYTAIGPEKGEDKTVPADGVKWLCEEAGEGSGYVVSSSYPIPLTGTGEDRDVQPPHRQAANYYRQDVLDASRNFLVTMSEPSSVSPKPVRTEITRDGVVRTLAGSGGTRAAAAAVAPRAG